MSGATANAFLYGDFTPDQRGKALHESALIMVTGANSNWAMTLEEKDVDAIQYFITNAQSN